MSDKENPARRLHDVLVKMQRKTDGRTKDVLAGALGMTERPQHEVAEAILQFYALFDDVIACLREDKSISEDLYIKPITDLRQAISIFDLNTGWTNYRSQLHSVDMRSLEHAIYELDRRPLPPAIASNILEEFALDVDALYNRVDNSDLPDELRRPVLEMLYEISKAIRLHAARGARPLKRALLLNAGTLVTNHHLFEQYEQTQEVRDYMGAIERLTKIIPVAADSTTLISAGWNAIKGLLSSGS